MIASLRLPWLSLRLPLFVGKLAFMFFIGLHGGRKAKVGWAAKVYRRGSSDEAVGNSV